MFKSDSKGIFSIKFILTAIVATTAFMAVVFMLLDNTGLLDSDGGTMIIQDNIVLGEGNLGVIDAVLAGAVFAVLPIFLLVVFTMTGAMIALGLVFAFVAIVLALLLPVGIMGLPLLLIVGLIGLLLRKKKQDAPT